MTKRTPPPPHIFKLTALSLAVLVTLSANANTVQIATPQDLGTLQSDDKGQSEATAISADGSIVIGKANLAKNGVDWSNLTDNTPTVWQGTGHKTKSTGFPHRVAPNAGLYMGEGVPTFPISAEERAKYKSVISDISDNGTVVVGLSSTSVNGVVYYSTNATPTVWTGGNFANAISLKLPADYTNSTANATLVSGNGKVVGGQGIITDDNSDAQSFAVTWSGDNYGTLTELPTIDRKGYTALSALNQDGKIGIGVFVEKDKSITEHSQGLVWHGANWQTMTKLSADSQQYSNPMDISNDGSIIVGATNSHINGIDSPRAVIWSGNQWQDAQELKTDPNILASDARVISGNGKVIGGQAISNQGDISATIWYGNNFAKSAYLPSLKKDGTGNTTITDLNADGTIAVGYSDSDHTYQDTSNNNEETTITRATLWKLGSATATTPPSTGTTPPATNPTPPSTPPAVNPPTQPTNPTPPVTPPTNPPVTPPVVTPPVTPSPVTPPTNPPVTPPTTPVVIGRIDVDNTARTVAKLGADSLSLMNMQSHALDRLQYNCVRYQGACFGLQHDVHTGKSQTEERTLDVAVGANVGYGFGNGLSVGLAIDHSANRKLPTSYRHDDDGVGVGAVVRYQSPTGIYGEISGAYDNYTAQITRPLLPNTELGVSDAKIKGVAYTAKVGKAFNSEQKSFNAYAGITHKDISRDAYSENDSSAFPISYGKIEHKQTSAIAGLKSRVGISDKLSWVSDVQISQKLSGDDSTFTASLTGVDKYNFSHTTKTAKTTGVLGTGLRYQTHPTTHIELMPYVNKGIDDETGKGVVLRVESFFD